MKKDEDENEDEEEAEAEKDDELYPVKSPCRGG
jgi:hypothetical protein